MILSVPEEKPDITIEALRAALGQRGLVFGYGSVQRLLARHGITRKKRPAMQRSKTARTC